MFALFMGAEKIDRQNESAAPLTMLFLHLYVITYQETLYGLVWIECVLLFFLVSDILL